MDELERDYLARVPLWRRIEEEAKFILDAALRSAAVKTHSLLSRTKTLDSVREKAARKNYDEPLVALDDLVGVRVVCLLRSDLARVAEIVRQQFAILSEDNKLSGADLNVFGYQSVHFVVTLPPSCVGPRYEGLHETRFEVQLRTLAMDAWASLSHYLDYKNEADIPRALRKDFFALSGLFYVADTHFEMFYAERQKSQQSAESSVSATPAVGQEINLDTLSAFLRKRYPDRVHVPAPGLSELIGELIESGYDTLDKLHGALDASAEAFLQYEKKYPPDSATKRFADTGVVRISLGVFDPEYAKRKYPNDGPMNVFRKLIKTS